MPQSHFIKLPRLLISAGTWWWKTASRRRFTRPCVSSASDGLTEQEASEPPSAPSLRGQSADKAGPPRLEKKHKKSINNLVASHRWPTWLSSSRTPVSQLYYLFPRHVVSCARPNLAKPKRATLGRPTPEPLSAPSPFRGSAAPEQATQPPAMRIALSQLLAAAPLLSVASAALAGPVQDRAAGKKSIAHCRLEGVGA